VSASIPNDAIFPVVIIGSGIAGLSAASHLAERGIPPLILEADSQWPGGRMGGGAPVTFRSSTREDWINRWGNKIEIQEAGSAVRWGWIPAPFHYLQLLFRPNVWTTITPLEWLSLPGYLFSILMTIGFDPVSEGVALDGMMMDDYFLGWTPKLRATFSGLANNLMAAPNEEITLTGLIAAVRFYSMLRRDSWWLDFMPGNSHTYLIQPLIDKIESMGGMLMLGARAKTLERTGDNWRVRVEDARRGMRSLMAEKVVLAVDPLAASRLLEASPDTTTIAAQLKIPSALRSSTVRLWFDRSPKQGAPSGMFTGDVVFNNFFWVHRLFEEFREWHDLIGGSVIELHLYGTDDQLDQPDQMQIVLATREVQRAFPELRGHFVRGAVRHNERSMTRFRVPTQESLHVKTPWHGIFACGDWIGYPTSTMWIERCCVTGIAAANHILEMNDLEPYSIIPVRRPEGLALMLGVLVRVLRWILSPLILGSVWLLRRVRTASQQ
jgi:isorenieratene synthase